MDASSPQPRRWLWIAAWLLLTVYFVSPPREVYDQTLDRSNYATYAYFVTHGMQWGVDVMPMPGPLGFVLFGYCYSGELYGARLIGDLFLCAGFSAMLLGLFHRAGRGAVRWFWLGVMVLVVPLIDDLLLDTAVLLSGICLLLSPPGKPDRWAYLGAILLAFICLIKGTHVMMVGAVFGTVTLLGLAERRPARVIRPAIAFLVTFIVLWLLAQQKLTSLPAFLQATAQLASGYSLTMGLEEDPFFFHVGLTIVAGLLIVLTWSLAFGARTIRSLSILLLICLFSFIKWKHGFVRADGHVYIFYASAALIAITTWFVSFSKLGAEGDRAAPPRWRSLVGLALITTVTGFATVASIQFWLGRFATVAGSVPVRLSTHTRYLVRPGATRADLDRELAQVRVATDLPQFRQEIGGKTVDFMGNEEGIILLNDLRYHPRPMGGGTFNVVNSWLQRQNEAFVASPQRAPAYQILKLAEFDGRLPTGDDGLALRAILDCYRPVLMQREYLLLKRERERPPDASPRLLSTVGVRPGEIISVPQPESGQLILFSIQAPFTTYGRLRAFLYRPPVLEGRFFTEDYPRGHSFVLKPAILQDPVILSPFVENTIDYLRLYGDGTGNRVQSLQLDAAPGFAAGELSVSFFSAARPPASQATEIDEILTYDRFPLYNRLPADLVTQETGIKELSNEPITLVHAPGSITWKLEPTDQQVIFSYGLIPKAYLNGGNSDGVEFNVEVIWPPTDGRVVFKHMIRPRTVTEDRGMHRARVLLPPFEPGAQLRIRTHPGPDNDGANDQAYITRVNIKAGPPRAEQFSGLGVIPANGRLPHGSVASVDTQPVFLLHAPNELALNVPAGVKTLQAKVGLLPGAYTNGGNTDGVGYSVFLTQADGRREKIWSRLLDPVHRDEDRGFVAITVSLPPTDGKAQLTVVTDIGPNGDRSWDQSYIAQVHFE
ncbi:MAG: hypothetical protein ABIV50_07490 [Opitutus sp.]